MPSNDANARAKIAAALMSKRPERIASVLKRYTLNAETGCWIWGGVVDHGGYGKINRKIFGTSFAHRYFYTTHRGQIPDGMNVLHACDTPRCVNPDHLFIGTQADNVHDMIHKGRSWPQTSPELVKKGSAHPCARLSEEQVMQIRAARLTGESQRSVARRFGISQTTVSAIATRKLWAHLPDPSEAKSDRALPRTNGMVKW